MASFLDYGGASRLVAKIKGLLSGFVPTSRTINGKALSSNITLTASDVSARPSSWTPTASDVGAVPTSRTVNGKALTDNITLSASDVSALPSSTDLSVYAPKDSPVFTGSISMGRNASNNIGETSVAIGFNNTASSR